MPPQGSVILLAHQSVSFENSAVFSPCNPMVVVSLPAWGRAEEPSEPRRAIQEAKGIKEKKIHEILLEGKDFQGCGCITSSVWSTGLHF